MGKKNSQLHIMVETKFLNELKQKAIEKESTLSNYCRQKLKDDTQLNRIEELIKEILKNFI